MRGSALRQTRRHGSEQPKSTNAGSPNFRPRLGFGRCASSRRIIIFGRRLPHGRIHSALLFGLGVPQSLASPSIEL
jgi:hypothetical protein